MLKLHPCQHLIDNEYWVETDSGRWVVKPKKGHESFVISQLMKFKK